MDIIHTSGVTSFESVLFFSPLACFYFGRGSSFEPIIFDLFI